MSVTSLLRPFFVRRAKVCYANAVNGRQTQCQQLEYLLNKGGHTRFGEEIGLDKCCNYEEFRKHIEIHPYEKLRPWVERMINGERDLLWPGVTKKYAQSSGTSDGKSKYIPITADSLSRNHYVGTLSTVARYLMLNPRSRMIDGKGLILGGSFANELDLPKGVRVGDLSATLIDSMNPLANLIRVPSKKVALMVDWSEKLPAIINAARRSNVTNISGVPSWFLTLLRRMLEETGAKDIHSVWPALEVFFHGGIAFGPYRSQYDSIIDPSRMNYFENYNASEGFFAIQASMNTPEMMLLMDAGVFYEFLPLGATEGRDALAPWEVKAGHTYSLIISAPNGLWRYPIGDTVKVTSTNPLCIVIAGRTRHFINAFGEELMVHNADAAITATEKITSTEVANYTAAPVYAVDGHRGYHQWLVEFSHPMTCEQLQAWGATLDTELRRVNSDYDAKRKGDIFLAPPQVVVAPTGLFDRWLASTGKLGGQRKVPRLSNNRSIIEPMLSLINSNHI